MLAILIQIAPMEASVAFFSTMGAACQHKVATVSLSTFVWAALLSPGEKDVAINYTLILGTGGPPN